MDADQDLRRPVTVIREQVDGEREHRDDHGQGQDAPPRHPAHHHEVGGEHRQHEQSHVTEEPLGARRAVPEIRGDPCHLHGHGRDHGEDQHHRPRRGTRVGGRRDDQLLPQPVAVLAGELGGERVDRADPAHRDQEGLVGAEPRALEIGHGIAQVRFELGGIRLVDGLVAPNRGAPLLHQLLAHAPAA